MSFTSPTVVTTPTTLITTSDSASAAQSRMATRSTSLFNHRFINFLTVLFYHTARVAPSETEVALKNGWLVFGRNKDFYDFTGFPEPGNSSLSIFDPESGEFVPILTTGGVPGDLTENPWIIIRRRSMEDEDCLLLETSIAALLESREAARHYFDGEPVVDYSLTQDGSETDVDDVSTVAMDGSNMVIVSDDSDQDYEPGQDSSEDGSGSEMEYEYEDESTEEEAEETDEEDEVQVIIDLTWMSD